MKFKKKNAIIIFIILSIILFFLLKDDYQNIVNTLLLASKKLIFIAVLMMVLYWIIKAFSLYLVVKNNGVKVKYYKILELVIINQFFCGITPFAVGGEPMQIYMLNKMGIEMLPATNMVIQEFILYQISLILIGIISIFVNLYFDLFQFTPLLTQLVILGFTINFIVAIFLILISFSKKFSRLIVSLGIKLLYKVKIVKNREEKMAEWDIKLKDYNRSADVLRKNKKLFITCILVNMTTITILYIIPFVVFKSFNYKINILESITYAAFIAVMGNFVPIPGGSGGIEFGFLTFFGAIVPSSIIKSALIVWRFITYYFGMIVGGTLFALYKGDEKIENRSI